MTKRFISMFLVLCMVVTMVPVQAFAADGGSISNCTVSDVTLYSKDNTSGGLVGWIYNNGTISNCSVGGNTKIESLRYAL